MLVVARKPSQGFWIGGAFVMVTKVRGNAVSVGIVAPRDMEILRDDALSEEEHQERLSQLGEVISIEKESSGT